MALPSILVVCRDPRVATALAGDAAVLTADATDEALRAARGLGIEVAISDDPALLGRIHHAAPAVSCLLVEETPESADPAAIRGRVAQELDQRRRRRERDRRVEAFGLMVESMGDGVIMTDERSEVILINPAARRLLGLPADLAVTTKYLKEKLGFYPFDLIGLGNASHEELVVGEKTLHSMVSPVHDATNRSVGVVVVLRDITEWKELDRRKEDFVSVVSHELRTPLTSIAGALDIVLKEYAGNVSDKQRRYLEMARDSCGKLHVIVDDLLDVARYERGKMPMQFRSLDLSRLVTDVVDRFRAAAEAKQVMLVVREPSRGGTRDARDIRIQGDADRLAQVMNNLISNAIKFTPEGGRVEVEVFGPGVASAHVGVSVWNNGDAIREEDRERVFDKFEQGQPSSTRRVGGTGLGLAISRAIVEGHGGKIWVENERVGTKFVFTLPAAPAATSPRTVEQPREVSPGGDAKPKVADSGRQVLVVDDDRYAAYVLKGVLMAAGHRVSVVHDADEALSAAREKKFDLVTIDVTMRGADPLAIVQTLKHDPDTRHAGVIAMAPSAATSSAPVSSSPAATSSSPVAVAVAVPFTVAINVAEAREAAIAAGADAFLAKPVDVELFRDTCAHLLAEGVGALKRKVLVVDDDPGVRMICREVLENAGYVVREAEDGEHALTEGLRFRPELILLDLMMPDCDGFQAAKRFRADRATAMTPIIFVSARGQTADKVRAFKLGAEDYLVKPFDSAELVARVEKALERKDRQLGASPTTALPGAGAIEAEIERRLRDGGDYAFCYLDLDNLKSFNDYYGIAKADGVIRQTGDLVREVVSREGSAGDFIGHIAGDDFVFISTADRVDRICQTICRTFDRLVPLYYNKIDRERGYIETHDRYGVLRKFPIMSVSIAALTLMRGGRPAFLTYADLAAAAAEEKQRAKAIDGSCYVRDGVVLLPAQATATVA